MTNDYWKDYASFIKIVESNTGHSPADLLSAYKLLVEELENNDILEWIYEDQSEGYTRTKIQLILESSDLNGNALLKEFEEKIKVLDSRMEKFIKKQTVENSGWQKGFSPDLIDWDKVKKG